MQPSGILRIRRPNRLRYPWLAALPMVIWQGAAAQSVPEPVAARRLYVEPFTTREGSEKLRDGVIAELRKNSVALASSESSADVILGGGGEIWVKGYRSLNPRSGRLPSDGTPIYGGYLAVELKDAKGETLWSYLVTPGAVSGDVSKDLSRQIAEHVEKALKLENSPSITTPSSQPKAVLRGAGATFPYPLYAKWFTNYMRQNPNVAMSYEPIGSEAGIRKLLAAEVDFGASDSPEAIHDLAPADESKYLLFPSVIGAVVPIVNLPGITGEIAFTPEVLAGIYLGKIVKWNDPALKAINPHLRLPDLDIVVVHRADGSGTSYAWTDYLSKTNPDWKSEIGASLAPHWPVGRAAAGNEGVAGVVKEFGGSIGYVEFIYALQHHLSYGKVRNRKGEFVEASLESIGVAAGQAVEISDNLKISIVNPPGAGAYPISTFTWLMIPAHIPDASRKDAISGFLKWMLGPGQTQAAALGYLGLPKELIAREEAAIAKLF